MKENILGYGVDDLDVQACCDSIFQRLSTGRKGWLACFNPHSYVVALDDPAFQIALRSADWLVPDGVGVVLGSRFLGGDVLGRVTGSDIFFGLQERMEMQGGFSVFFIGSTEETLAEIRRRLSMDFPRVKLAGTYSPPFKAEYSQAEIDEMVCAINQSKPDVLWVGMTAPKQEKWIHDCLPLLDVKVACAIGAVFDFYVGRVKRSHPVFQRMGLEWLPRLLQEPRRLWRRMFVSAPIFVLHIVREKLSRS